MSSSNLEKVEHADFGTRVSLTDKGGRSGDRWW